MTSFAKREYKLLTEGNATFYVSKAECAISRNGRSMIVLSLDTTDSRGEREMVKDWLVDGYPTKGRMFLESIGRQDLLEVKNLDPFVKELEKCTGRGRIIHAQFESAKGEKITTNRMDEYYIKDMNTITVGPVRPDDAALDDELPF